MNSAPASRSAPSMIASCASRSSPRWLWANVGMPSAAAMLSPRASGWLLATSTISYGQSGRREWNSSEDIVVPLPESITATRALGIVSGFPRLACAPGFARSAHGAAARAFDHLADAHDFLAGGLELGGDFAGQLGGHGQHHPNAAIERARHLARLDVALSLQERHQPRLLPRVGVDHGVRAFGQHAGDILEQPAAGDVGERVNLAGAHDRQQAFHVDARWLDQCFDE